MRTLDGLFGHSKVTEEKKVGRMTERGKRRSLILFVAVVALLALLPQAAVGSATHATTHLASPFASSGPPPTWFQLAPTGTLPAPRASFDRVLAYDQTRNRMIIFGGDTTGGSLLNDTWVLVGADGTAAHPHWIKLNTVNTPAARKLHSGVYDAANNRLIIYGGCLGLCTPIDTNVYVLSHANGLGGTPTWTQLSTTGGPPPARDEASTVYDQTSNSLIVFGGDNCCGGRFNDTWVLSNANGLAASTPTWTQLSTTGGPPPARVRHSAIYDVTNNRMIIFGGNDCCGNTLNDTWVLSNANGLAASTPTWTQLSPTGGPPFARSSHGAVYNATTNDMIIFGGGGSTGLLNDIWVLSNANGLSASTPTWTQAIPVSTSPTPRAEFVANYRSTSQRLVIFGGADSSSDLNETWVLMFIR